MRRDSATDSEFRGYYYGMDADTLRDTIRARLTGLAITPHHAARLARIGDNTLRDYLAGADLRSAAALRLAAALGLRVAVTQVRGFTPPAPAPAGRPKNTLRNSATGH